MNQNEVIGKWAVEKGLLDCWHEAHSVGTKRPFIGKSECKCGEWSYTDFNNPDYSIYENIAHVLEELLRLGWDVETNVGPGCSPDANSYYVDIKEMFVYSLAWADLPTTLRDMVAELISKGEV